MIGLFGVSLKGTSSRFGFKFMSHLCRSFTGDILFTYNFAAKLNFLGVSFNFK